MIRTDDPGSTPRGHPRTADTAEPAPGHTAARHAHRTESGSLLAAATVGVIAGIDNIAVGLAIAALLFSGTLSAGLGIGVGTVLLAATLLALIIALGSGLRNAVALVQESSVAVLAATLATTVATMPGTAAERIPTALAVIGVSTVFTGLALWLTGALRLGRFVRLLPYPVVAGFVAASGWLLVEGAYLIMTDPAHAGASADAWPWLAIAPAAGFAAALLLALRFVGGIYVAPAMLIAAIGGFHVVLGVLGLDLDDARAIGLLPTVDAAAGIVLPDTTLLDRIDWTVVIQAWPGFVAVAAIGLVGTLLNTGGVELSTGREADHDRELRVTGWANMIAGFSGGPSGYTGLGITLLAERLGAASRAAGVATALVLLAGLFFADWLVGGIPVFVTSGLVLYLGLELLLSWLVETRRRLPLSEWLIIVLITVVVALTGFVEGLLTGIVVCAGMFIYNYSRLPVVRNAASGADRRSSVDRSPGASRLLASHGHATMVLTLQGYLFFATADRIVDQVRQRLAEATLTPLRFLVLDFRHVSGIDSAAIASFIKIDTLARREAFRIVYTHLPASVQLQMVRGGLDPGRDDVIRVEPDLDHALEYCEEALLQSPAESLGRPDNANPLRAAFGDVARLEDLIATMDRLDLSPGDAFIRAGESADDVFFVASGWVRVQLSLPDGRLLRLRTMTSGAVVGEIALYLGQRRTADVVCEKPATVYRMSRERLEHIERENSELAAVFHRVVAVGLSDKLTIANRAIQAAQA